LDGRRCQERRGMIDIRNGSDLRTTYRILHDMQELVPLSGREEAGQGHIQ
jgi:hypothetical protein